METQERINALESRQLELRALMAKSDAHASKCVKMGTKFSTQYPEEAAAYRAANAEYNENEAALQDLYSQRDEELAAEAGKED